MKELTLLVWLTQLALSVAGPLVCYIWLAVWLREQFNLGTWVVICGILLGIWGAVDGLRMSLKTMERLSKKDKDDTAPPMSFNDHV